ncbi:DUF4982 domain-containing protein [Rathayibacter sp. VKM Ac-2760]|nr:DUF4982 domain-containing protein [Rathayibacter sp. VKM Ac-2760]
MTAAARSTEHRALDQWEFQAEGATEWRSIRLPHDAMISETRTPDAPGGPDTAYFPGGRYVYRTVWNADETSSPFVGLRFEGVQGDATVSVNGQLVGTVRSGYVEFELPVEHTIVWGAENEIVVVVDNEKQPASRWYPGSGLYRSVHLVLRPAIHIAPDGLRVRTLAFSPSSATVEVACLLENADDRVRVDIDLLDGDMVVASGSATGSQATVTLSVPDPKGWSADTPFLYDLAARVEIDGETVDSRHERVGLRTLSVDARQGLRINGETVKLRGACIHHDNGVLGAATHRAAEYRRVRKLKAAGFNAIRSAHNPMSRHLLDACDELGMYVLDELADYWIVSKTKHDFAWRFRDTWREDADRLVEKDRNRPSVVMYAAGNEIPETAKPEGVALTREITAYLHRLDPDRPVTVATNLFLNLMVSLDKSPYKEDSGAETSMAGSTEANVMINQIGRMMDIASRLPKADKASREAFAEVDIAGYNYGIGRYRHDVRAYPDRVILGSETLPSDVPRAWELVKKHPAIIGDFVWAGWEYLGEAGVAVWVPGKKAGLSKPYPYLIAGPGMFDLIGQPDITLRVAQAAWGVLDAPAIGVRPLDRSGTPMVRSAWRRTDAVESWSWRGCEGRTAEIEVYSIADEIELLLNGRRIGRRRVRRGRFVAAFTTDYEPGTLTAVAYRNGTEVSRSTLRTAAANVGVRIETDSTRIEAAGDDLVFAEITLADENGIVEMLVDEPVAVTVTGPGELIGLGTAAPATAEDFTASRRTTFRGRALAVVRPTGEPGTITITAQAQTRGRAERTVTAHDDRRSDRFAATVTSD